MSEESRKTTLLFVDDEENILQALKRLFRGNEYSVLTALSGKEALETLDKNEVDIVVSDMRMPEMNGATFLAEVHKKFPSTIRILLTGYSDLESTIDAVNNSGLYSYISKPWEDAQLLHVIKKAAEHIWSEKERKRLEKLSIEQNKKLEGFNTELEKIIEDRTDKLRRTTNTLKDIYFSMQNQYQTALNMFASTVDLFTMNSSRLCFEVANLAKKLAKENKLGSKSQENIYLAGLLHNVGLLSVPKNISEQPYMDLSREEKRIFEKHPIYAENNLMSLESLSEVSNIIRHHRERVSGRGYPDALTTDDIPVESRILSIAVDFYLLQNGSLTGEELTPKEALEFIKKNAADYYDPFIVNSLIDVRRQERRASDPIEKSGAELVANNMLSEPLFSFEDVLLLPAEFKLTTDIIRQLQDVELTAGKTFSARIKGK